MEEKELLEKLVTLMEKGQRQENLTARNEKLAKILRLLAGGTALATMLIAPNTGRIFKDFFKNNSDWNEWKAFNKNYLRRTIHSLEAQKLVEIVDHGGWGEVKLTQNGRKKIIKLGLESLTISKPDHWDGKWRLVFYDIFDGNKRKREEFRHRLKSAGFYPLQKSVYLHAYPCEKEIEFLKYFLGIGGSVRVVIAEKIENDHQFRAYFGVT
jgi:hypothetical protein